MALLQSAGLQVRVVRTGGGFRDDPYTADELLERAAQLGEQLRNEQTARMDADKFIAAQKAEWNQVPQLKAQLNEVTAELHAERRARTQTEQLLSATRVDTRVLIDTQDELSKLQAKHAAMMSLLQQATARLGQSEAEASEREACLERKMAALRQVAMAALETELKTRPSSYVPSPAPPSPRSAGLSSSSSAPNMSRSPPSPPSPTWGWAEEDSRQSPRRRTSAATCQPPAAGASSSYRDVGRCGEITGASSCSHGGGFGPQPVGLSPGKKVEAVQRPPPPPLPPPMPPPPLPSSSYRDVGRCGEMPPPPLPSRAVPALWDAESLGSDSLGSPAGTMGAAMMGAATTRASPRSERVAPTPSRLEQQRDARRQMYHHLKHVQLAKEQKRPHGHS